ncbi:hypothetical protein HDU98_004287 [Podochytrium sp. JEL0797]|nr:hypothetical protein HDU98_004287 [Podochytrium sp. JEL0797]
MADSLTTIVQSADGNVVATLFLSSRYLAGIDHADDTIILDFDSSLGILCQITTALGSPSMPCPATMSGGECVAISCLGPAPQRVFTDVFLAQFSICPSNAVTCGLNYHTISSGTVSLSPAGQIAQVPLPSPIPNDRGLGNGVVTTANAVATAITIIAPGDQSSTVFAPAKTILVTSPANSTEITPSTQASRGPPIAAIVCTLAAVLVLLCIAICFVLRRKRQRAKANRQAARESLSRVHTSGPYYFSSTAPDTPVPPIPPSKDSSSAVLRSMASSTSLDSIKRFYLERAPRQQKQEHETKVEIPNFVPHPDQLAARPFSAGNAQQHARTYPPSAGDALFSRVE